MKEPIEIAVGKDRAIATNSAHQRVISGVDSGKGIAFILTIFS
jgi:hypothetical protein